MHTFVVALLFVLSILSTAIQAHPSTSTPDSTSNTLLSSCLLSKGIKNFSYQSNSSTSPFNQLLTFSIQNLRYSLPSTPKPAIIIFPLSKYQLQQAILCLEQRSLTIRVRSGGHSYEGLSYTTSYHIPFGLIDLSNLNQVRVDPASATAWVESGATLGEIYYNVAVKSNGTLGFTAGSCATVGSGGHISGGGFGLLSRKYGLAADNILNLIFIDPNVRILNRSMMDEDVFWALRGGGGGSWGVVYAWKLQLIPVPNRVTWFTISHAGPIEPLANLVHKWQFVAPNLPNEFYLSTTISGSKDGNGSVSFTGLYLGSKGSAFLILSDRYPELMISESNLEEMSWIDSVVQAAGLNSVSDLRNRSTNSKNFFKAKSDYVQTPISKEGLIGAMKILTKEPSGFIICDPYGGAMARIGGRDSPFPHRAGNLFSIQYLIDWTKAEEGMADKYIAWLRDFYAYMGSFVSNNPRAAYVNYLDLDLGTNNWTVGTRSTVDDVNHARLWGDAYFLWNYDRLVRAKTKIDPENVFNNEQSIPPLPK
ncbi:FAD-binding Berberine family protein [Rhynchospora pubera]|uniref:FAD-binding Berberine family protein n=1 Tax=Rhynchospora pubera TaxID=906938 RepID=A0AAV8EDP0_9POAL|nr:FAD-binding Berberine family protein [Rhynchospora pubera]